MTEGYEMAKTDVTDVEDNPGDDKSVKMDPEPKKKPQFMAAFAGNLASVVTGCIIGWTSPSLFHLEQPDTPIPITKDENSWISSLMPLAAAVGPWPAGYFAEKFGRKKGLLFSFVIATASWVCLAAGTSVPVIYAGRIFSGLCVGWVFTILPMYCGEIAHSAVRGAIGSLMQLFIVFGLLFDYCIGPYVPYIWLSIASAFIPVLFVAAFIWMPESPYYLLGVSEKDAAKKALQWLRGHPDVDNELKNMQADVEKAQSQSGSIKDLFATKGNIKALYLSIGLVSFQQLSGINVVLFNAQNIFAEAGGSLTADVSTIITGVVMLVASFATPLVVDRLGRKILLLISSIGMAAAEGVLGLCFYLKDNGTDTSSFSFLPVLSVIVYIIVYSIGFGPLPWAVMGEMFPANIKSLASTLTASICWLLGFLLTRFFNDMVNAIGMGFSFWVFAICCVLAAAFCFVLLPETKGKTLSEIQDILSR